jgi:hypothetical protein
MPPSWTAAGGERGICRPPDGCSRANQRWSCERCRAYGAVAALQSTPRAISVARRVLEVSEHNVLVGRGASRFAAAQGFPAEEVLTPEAKRAWEEWRAEQVGCFTPSSLRGLWRCVALLRRKRSDAVVAGAKGR